MRKLRTSRAESTRDDFAEQVRAVMALPLSDGERAEVLRRLLDAKGTAK